MSSKNKRTVQRSTYRATTRHAKPSKEKHVRTLVLQTFNRDGSVEELIKALSKRLEKQNWAVVLKTLMIFHRCFRDGDATFIEAMKSRSNLVFGLRTFSALAPPNHLFTVFVKKYAKYLEEKVSVLRLLGYQFEKNQEIAKTVKGQGMFKVVPKLQSQLNALLNCKMKSQHVGVHTLIHHAYILLCQDSLVLYAMLNEVILRMLDLYWKMNRKDASRTLGIYKLFVKETDALIGLYEIGRNFIRQLPQINKAESSIINQMEKYLDSLGGAADSDSDDEGDTRRKRKGKKGRRDDSDDDSYGEMLNTRAGQEVYDENDYDDADDDDDDDDSSDDGDEPDYFKDFFAGMPTLQNNPFAQFQPPPTSSNPFQPTAPQQHPQQLYGSPGTGSGFFGQPGTQSQAFQPKSVQSSSGFGAQANPFGSSSGANPFASAPAPSSNPFGGPASNDPFAFGGGQLVPTQQQNAFGTAPNPFAAPSTFGSNPQPSPFGPPQPSGGYGNQPNGGYGSQPANPFSGGPYGQQPYTQPQQQQPLNPFM